MLTSSKLCKLYKHLHKCTHAWGTIWAKGSSNILSLPSKCSCAPLTQAKKNQMAGFYDLYLTQDMSNKNLYSQWSSTEPLARVEMWIIWLTEWKQAGLTWTQEMKTKWLHIAALHYDDWLFYNMSLYGFPHIFLQLPTGHSPHQNNLPTPPLFFKSSQV